MKHRHLFQLLILPVLLFNPMGTSRLARTNPEPSITVTIDHSDVSIGNTAVVSVSLNNVPATGYSSAEFTCTYNMNLMQAGNITAADLFGTNPITVINGPQNGQFILAIAGNQGNKAATSGLAFKFSAKSLQAGQAIITCSVQVSEGTNSLSQLSSASASFNIPVDPSSSVCDKAAFIAHITTPPGTVMYAGQVFIKSWRITNIGTCVWTTAYQIVFFSGEKMSAPSMLALPVNISPGQTADLSIQMTAPTTPGSYQGYWMFRNSSGTIFGTGPQANEPWSVDINVVAGSTPTYAQPTPTFSGSGNPPTPYITPSGPRATALPGTTYDFVSNACSATWFSGTGQVLPCPGTEDDVRGFMKILDHPLLETGIVDSRAGILMVPQGVNNGYIQGIYPAYRVQSGDRFRATIGCEGGATGCYVVYRLDYAISGSSQINTFWAFVERYDGYPYNVDLDLTPLAGQDVKFILTILSTGSPVGDRALWINPILLRTGTAFTSTPSPTLTPSSTITLTTTPTSTPTITITTTPSEEPGIITISGKVIASKLVTISLYNGEDSLINTVTTETDGSFGFAVYSGTYSIRAEAVGALIARSDFVLGYRAIRSMQTITLSAGDIDGNNTIDQYDALTIGMNYNGSAPASADLNNDGTINILDLELLALNYQKSGPTPWQ